MRYPFLPLQGCSDSSFNIFSLNFNLINNNFFSKYDKSHPRCCKGNICHAVVTEKGTPPEGYLKKVFFSCWLAAQTPSLRGKCCQMLTRLSLDLSLVFLERSLQENLGYLVHSLIFYYQVNGNTLN